ncbi:MAG: hypothetical protein J6J42_12215 [Lachnospiraceae bacterium]|nr:hypothetical protein [Lachnospiraceae bacterium]
MTDIEKSIEKALIASKPLNCELCGERVYYLDGGQYQCRKCGNIMLDDFGKVKAYIDKNGPSPAMAISSATGVSTEVIEVFLRKGRLEIPEGSRYYVKCERCHCSIRYGRFCPDCVKDTAVEIKAVFADEVGEKPKYEWNPDMAGRIRFVDRRWKK